MIPKMLFLWILILSLLWGCEIYSDILTIPDYQPSLAIHAILSPQEGGDVYIKYTKPIDSTNAQPVPELPEFSVLLFENGEMKYTFTDQDDGHFILDTAGLELFPDRDYHIEVIDNTGKMILKSGTDRLPAVPDVVFSRFYQDTTTFPEENYLEVEINLDPNSKTSYHFRKDYSIDGGQIFIRGRDPEYGRFSIRQLYHSSDYPAGTLLTTLNAPTFIKPHPGADNQYVNAAKLWVDHLSPGLTLYIQDVADANESYGDPFNTSHPVYSNIEGGYGVFGMYHSWVGVEPLIY